MSYKAKSNRYSDAVYHRCGKSGLKLPAVSLGLWHNFGTNGDFKNMQRMCFTAFDNGITHFDLANNYGPVPGSAEENFGKILNNDMKSYRDEMIISTKAGYLMWDGPYGEWGSKKYLIASLDQSLLRMGLDYVDIFYHHRPDDETDLWETMHALDTAVKSGKALYVGLSNYNGEQMEKASKILKELNCPFIINQNKFSILDRTPQNNGLLKASEKQGKGVIVFSPLEQGLLSDKYLNEIPKNSRMSSESIFLQPDRLTPELLGKLKRLNEVALNRGQTLAQTALCWVLNHKAVTSVLIGASTPEQIIENVKATKNLKFTKEELDLIDQIAL